MTQGMARSCSRLKPMTRSFITVSTGLPLNIEKAVPRQIAHHPLFPTRSGNFLRRKPAELHHKAVSFISPRPMIRHVSFAGLFERGLNQAVLHKGRARSSGVSTEAGA